MTNAVPCHRCKSPPTVEEGWSDDTIVQCQDCFDEDDRCFDDDADKAVAQWNDLQAALSAAATGTLGPAHVVTFLKQIRLRADDGERAHRAEKKLWRDVLLAIAENRCDELVMCTSLALSTSHIKFERWFA